MLFFALIIYFTIAIPLYGLIALFVPEGRDVFAWWWGSAIYGGSIVTSIFIAFLVDSYFPDSKKSLAILSKTKGIRSLAIMSSLLVISYFVYRIFVSDNPIHFSMLFRGHLLDFTLPFLIISTLNALGIDLPLPYVNKIMVTPDGETDPNFDPEEEKPEADPEISDAIIYKKYAWKYEGQKFSFDLSIRGELYNKQKNEVRNLDVTQWAKTYVLDGLCEEVRDLSHKLCKNQNAFGSLKEVEFILNFVQSIVTYTHDVGEYPKYPLETLVEEKGDCEDFSILGAAILKSMGYEVAMLYVPGHAALGVAGTSDIKGVSKEHEGLSYYYCEMTAEGWKLGELPESHTASDIEVSPVPSPPPKVVRPNS